ncbi:MAG: response regulator transcription factor, partial [Pirellulales bacterium]|nr:response regulator transcription factor [Pirellulales bacterium]
RSLAPDALLLDWGFPAEEVFDLAARMTGEGTVRAVGVLDVEFAFFHAKRTLAIPRAAYFTRFDPFEHICQELTSMVLGAGATPAEQRPEQTPHLPASNDDDRPLALLSGREEELFLLLAQGLSVRQSAERMGLAASTVDNHKWRLMKKLCVRRTSQLTRLAMRAGLIE